MESVLISIKPKWCAKIVNKEKTIEVRKNRPKLNIPFKVYIYCTSVKSMNLQEYCDVHMKTNGRVDDWNGKVIGEFICDKVVNINYSCDDVGGWWHETIDENCDEKDMCLSWEDVDRYLGETWGFGWHISDLKIYDEAKELNVFHKPIMATGLRYEDDEITKAPQSWCYVEGLEG